MANYVTLDYDYLMHQIEEEIRKSIYEIGIAGNEAGINQCVQYANGILEALDIMSLAIEGSDDDLNYQKIRKYLNKAKTDVMRENTRAKAKLRGYNV